MLDDLSNKLETALKKIRGQGKLTEKKFLIPARDQAVFF